jgi:hypothetical protein
LYQITTTKHIASPTGIPTLGIFGRHGWGHTQKHCLYLHACICVCEKQSNMKSERDQFSLSLSEETVATIQKALADIISFSWLYWARMAWQSEDWIWRENKEHKWEGANQPASTQRCMTVKGAGTHWGFGRD